MKNHYKIKVLRLLSTYMIGSLMWCLSFNSSFAQGNYTVLTRGLPIAIIPNTGTVTTIGTGDDFSTTAPIGFTFYFYNTAYTSLKINSNGYIAFGTDPNYPPGYYPFPLPSSGAVNLLLFAWANLFIGPEATVNYFVSGTAPNRIMVINYRNVRHQSGESGNNVDVQLQLYEGSNAIEIHNILNRSSGQYHLLGIQGTISQYLTQPSLNSISFSGTNALVNEMIRFYDCTPLAQTPVTTASTNTSCAGTSVTLSSTTGCVAPQVVKWSNGAIGASITVNPLTTTTYTAVCRNNATGCESATVSNSQVITVSGTVPIVTRNITGACGSQTITFTTQTLPAGVFQWKKDGVNIGSPNTGTSSSYVTTVGGSYTVDYTINTCLSTSIASVFAQNTVPIVTLNQSTSPSCTSTLTATNCSGTVYWYRSFNGVSYNYVTTSNPYIFTTSSTSSYYRATCVLNGCESAVSNVVTNTPNFTEVIPNNPSICSVDGSILLNASSANSGLTYQWKLNGTDIMGATSSSYAATTGGYYSVFTGLGACTYTSSQVYVNTVFPPTISITSSQSSPATITNGQSLVLTSNGCISSGGTVLWSTSETTSAITITPSSNASYTFTCTKTPCVVTSSAFVVNVNPLLPPTITSSSPTTCTGTSVTITGTCLGGSTISWNTLPVQTTSVITVSPSITTTYTATCTLGAASSNASISIGVFNGPITSLSSGNWTDASTWSCNCIPASCNDVTVEIGHNVIIPATLTGRLKNLTVRGIVDMKTTSMMKMK
jgi:hypothetical protein